MKKTIFLFGVLVCVLFSSCATIQSKHLIYVQELKGKSYDKVFNAALFGLNTHQTSLISADRSSGIIHTATGYLLITPADNYICYSASTYIEESEAHTTAEETRKILDERESVWKEEQSNIVDIINEAYEKLKEKQ